MLAADSLLNLGLLGTAGSRDANLAAYNSDLIIAFGTHLSNQLIGNDEVDFAPNAEVFVVDIDPLELLRLPKRFHTINEDLKIFLPVLDSKLRAIEFTFNLPEWKKRCEEFKELKDFGLPLELSLKNKYVGQYYFYKQLSCTFKSNDSVVVDGGGNTLFSALNSLRLKEGQHIVTGAGIGCMGSGLPHSIGASFAVPNSNVYCLIGDGSMQFNIQELATIEFAKLPIKVIIINNDGYKAIKDTQDNFFDRRFGVDQRTGLSFPSYQQIAVAYGIPYLSIHSDDEVLRALKIISEDLSPYICEVFVDPDTPLLPRGGFVKFEDNSIVRLPMHDMYPMLPRESDQNI